MIDQPAISNEYHFLQTCLQSRFNPIALEQAQTVTAQDGFDWDLVHERAEQESVAPLLYSILRDSGILPGWYEKKLRKVYIRYGFHNARLLQQLQYVVRDFTEHGIPIIILKGAALAETVYSNIALRPMVDLDILIHRTNIERALQVLDQMGYKLVDPEVHPGILAQYENELLLHKLGAVDIALELHWSLLDSPHYQQKLAMKWFWQTAETAQINDTRGLVLGPEATLLHLSSHLMLHHYGRGLLWQHDVAEVLVRNRSRIDWEMVMNKAQNFDLVLPLQHVVAHVNDHWLLEIANDILLSLSNLQPSSREQQVFGWLTAEDRPVAQRFWVDLATSASWKQRLEYAWRNLFPRPAYMRQRYQIKNRYLLPFYYPIRWLKGITSVFRS
jgi:hypothetical protein